MRPSSETPQAPLLPSNPFSFSPLVPFPPTPPTTPPPTSPGQRRSPSTSNSIPRTPLNLPAQHPHRAGQVIGLGIEGAELGWSGSSWVYTYPQDAEELGLRSPPLSHDLNDEADSVSISARTGSSIFDLEDFSSESFPYPPPRTPSTKELDETSPVSASSSTMEAPKAKVSKARRILRTRPPASPPPRMPLPTPPLSPSRFRLQSPCSVWPLAEIEQKGKRREEPVVRVERPAIKSPSMPLLRPAIIVPHIKPMSSQDLRLQCSSSRPSSSDSTSPISEYQPYEGIGRARLHVFRLRAWSFLPSGLLHLVFKHFPSTTTYPSDPSTPIAMWRNTLVACSRVNKAWSAQANEILYSRVWITSLRSFELLVQTMEHPRFAFSSPIRALKVSNFYEENWSAVARTMERFVDAMDGSGVSSAFQEVELDFGLWGGVYPRRRSGCVYAPDPNEKDLPTSKEWESFVRSLAGCPKLRSLRVSKRCWDDWRAGMRKEKDSLNVWSMLKTVDLYLRLERLELRGYPDWTEGYYAPFVLRDYEPWKEEARESSLRSVRRRNESFGSLGAVGAVCDSIRRKSWDREREKEKMSHRQHIRNKASITDSLRNYALGIDDEILFPFLRSFNLDLEILKDMKRHWTQAKDVGKWIGELKVHCGRSHTFTPSFPVHFYASHAGKNLTTIRAPFTPALSKALRRCTNLKTLDIAYLVWTESDREYFSDLLDKLPSSLTDLGITWLVPTSAELGEAIEEIHARMLLPFTFVPKLKRLAIGMEGWMNMRVGRKLSERCREKRIQLSWKDVGRLMRWEGLIRSGTHESKGWREPLVCRAVQKEQESKPWK
ncbi:hypothetical protein BT69DRAFT_1356322 [Atractiella rhizophila]|nr:hypothetical protein BT69DRAFT_1356322 [Atractiella rhizophila]